MNINLLERGLIMEEGKTGDKFDELIKKQEEREQRMRQVREEYIGEIKTPKKQITVKIFLNTHKKLKVIAIAKDTTIEKIATAIIEDKISDLDIVKYVKISFDNSEKIYGWLQRVDIDTVKLMNEILESVEDKE